MIEDYHERMESKVSNYMNNVTLLAADKNLVEIEELGGMGLKRNNKD